MPSVILRKKDTKNTGILQIQRRREGGREGSREREREGVYSKDEGTVIWCVDWKEARLFWGSQLSPPNFSWSDELDSTPGIPPAPPAADSLARRRSDGLNRCETSGELQIANGEGYERSLSQTSSWLASLRFLVEPLPKQRSEQIGLPSKSFLTAAFLSFLLVIFVLCAHCSCDG